jgi:hypothetical protein
LTWLPLAYLVYEYLWKPYLARRFPGRMVLIIAVVVSILVVGAFTLIESFMTFVIPYYGVSQFTQDTMLAKLNVEISSHPPLSRRTSSRPENLRPKNHPPPIGVYR